MCTWYSRQLRPTTSASVSSDGEASCGGVVRLEAGVEGAKDGSPLLLEPRLFCGMSGGGGKGSPWCAACSNVMKVTALGTQPVRQQKAGVKVA